MMTIKFWIQKSEKQVRFNTSEDNELEVTDGRITDVFSRIDAMKDFAVRVSDIKEWMIQNNLSKIEVELEE